MFRVLTTDGGPHPPEKWAMFTAQDIFDISKMAPSGAREMAARLAQLAIADALTVVHRQVQEDERAALASNEEHCAKPHDTSAYLDAALAAVEGALKGTPWEHQYADLDQYDALTRTLAAHFVEAQSIERKYHADRTGNPAAVAYRDLFLAGRR